ncbi:Transcriptional activator of proteases prtT [Cyphellophora attinorum]|uniref:Transcriptional activator of proteases prtT n=1 Tax=Cyphellophora attinorum TaxID=1664694 RepID=A0A0N0NP01_9EURO|nr:Transcriptional activator of proteases prtT [Phialophora attinorum]KPI41979.1 Transcriptional activator of proteases prtT [Phialophora attinorum]
MAPTSAAIALKEACSTQRTPEITRKITACVACRKLKIKCYMDDARPPCKRCKGRGLSCTVNKSIQMILDSDIAWKEELEQRVADLERRSSARDDTRPVNLEPFTQVQQHPPVGQSEALNPPQSTILDTAKRATAQARGGSMLNLACNPGSFPGSALVGQSTNDEGYRPSTRADLIAKGVITERTAIELFEFYALHLDHFAYNLLPENAELPSIRSRSSLLTSAICTVAAFCSSAKCYQECLASFREEVNAELFTSQHTFDDVRALCIGSFWLSDLSTALSALAVRFAAELNLHRCITKMPHTNPKCYDRTRLYFVVVICDHQCTLVRGRPPMTRAMRSLQNPRALLKSRHSVPADIRLISHLELWTLNTRMLDIFGADVGTPFPVEEKADELYQLAKYFDRWHKQWSDLVTSQDDLDMSTDPTLDLYYHIARLCLFAHTFRGVSPATPIFVPRSSQSRTDIAEFASHAVDSAIAIVTRFLETHAQAPVLPTYFATSLAFAAVILVTVCSRTMYSTFSDLSDPKKHEARNAVTQLCGLLTGLSLTLSPEHPLCVIAKGLQPVLQSLSTTHQTAPRIEVATIPAGNDFDGGLFTSREFSPDSHFQVNGPHYQQMPDDPMLTTVGGQPVMLPSTATEIDWSLFPVDFSAEFPDFTNV